MRFVQAEKPVSTKYTDADGEIQELKVSVETPQVESLDEFVTFAGGEEKALDFINGAIDTGSKNGARAYMRLAADKIREGTITVEKITEKAVEIAKGYTPGVGDRGPSKASKVEAYDSVRARLEAGEELTREELLEMLMATK